MSAIADIDTDSDWSVLRPLYKETPDLTDVKTRKAALYAISGVSLFAAAASIICYAAYPVAVPLVVTSLFLAIYSRSYIDYSDPSTIAKFRAEALRQPLLESVKRHGWERIFRYEILDQAAFETLFRSSAASLSFGAILALYNQARGHLQRVLKSGRDVHFVIPLPLEWKERFFLDTETMRVDAIVERFRLEELMAFEILDAGQVEILEGAKREIASYGERNVELHGQFDERTKGERAFLEAAIQAADRTYGAHPAHHLLWRANYCHCSHCGAFNQGQMLLIRELERSLEVARILRDSEIKAAQELYNRAVQPVRKEIDALLLLSKERYEEGVDRLDQEYRVSFLARIPA